MAPNSLTPAARAEARAEALITGHAELARRLETLTDFMDRLDLLDDNDELNLEVTRRQLETACDVAQASIAQEIINALAISPAAATLLKLDQEGPTTMTFPDP